MCNTRHRRGAIPSSIVIVLAVSALATGASTLPDLAEVLPSLSVDDESRLMREGQLLRFHDEGVSPGLLPNTELTAAAARQMIGSDLNIGIEGLFFTALDELPPLYTRIGDQERRLRLYNILRSVSTLVGLEYYSASRGEMRLLFEESWAIADARKPGLALPDPLVTAIPEEDAITIHQKDRSFATNQSTMHFKAGSDAFSAGIVNITPMRYKGLLRVVDPGNMQTHLIIVPVGEGLVIYGAMAAQTRNVRAFVHRARDSFTNRVTALTGWYRSRLDEEFGG